MIDRKKNYGIIDRRLETKGLVKMRANHVDSRVTTLTTFLPFEVSYGKDKVDFKKYSDLPIVIFVDNKAVWFDFLEEEDQVFKIMGKKYQVMGYPQATSTMLSLEGFMKIFGKNPYPNVRKNLNKIPEVNPEQLLYDIEDLIRKFVGLFDAKMEIKDDLYRLVTYWALQTYIYDVWSKTSYLKIMGVHDSGKSTLSRLMQLLTFCSERSTAKVTDSWFYRNLHAVGGVQCLDEMELKPKEVGQFLSILKAGWMKDSFVHLSDARDPKKSDAFNVFSPKLIAGTEVQSLDPIISSRTIEFTMRSAPPQYNYSIEDLYEDEIVEPLQELRDKLYFFRLRFAHEYRLRKKVDAKTKGSRNLNKEGTEILSNRQYDIYAPLLTMARWHGGKILVKSLINAIKNQIEIKKREFFETYDLPIIRTIYEATRPVKRVWLSARAISDTIIDTYGGTDPAKRRYMIARYDFTIVEKHLKGLGLSREKTYSIDGVEHLFVKTDLNDYIRKKGIKQTVDTKSQHQEVLDLVEIMVELQADNQIYADDGIPLDVIQDKMEYNPLIYLYQLANSPNPPVMKTKRNCWLALVKGGWE